MRQKVDQEKEGLDGLENELRQFEEERDYLKQEITDLRQEVDEKRNYKSGNSGAELDISIRNKLAQVEEAEEKRRRA